VTEAASVSVHTGREALAAGRWSDAATAFRIVLDRDGDPDARFGLGVAVFWLGETVEALRHWERAYAAWRRRGNVAQAALAAGYLSLAYRMSIGNDAAARGWLSRAERLVRDNELVDLQAWVLVCRAHREVDIGQLKAAEGSARKALELAQAAGDPDLELCALSELGAALVEQGHVDDGIALLDEAMAAALGGEGRDLDSVVLVSCRSISACSRAGDLRRATQWVRAADNFYRRFGSPHLYTTCRTHFAGILFATGQWENAERELHAALKIGAAGEPALHAEALAKLAELRVSQGRVAEAATLLDGYEDHPAAAYAVALIHLRRGDAAAAAALIRRRLSHTDEESLEAAALHDLLAEAQAAVGDSGPAAKLAAQPSERVRAGIADIILARRERALGRTLLAAASVAEAAEHFERAAVTFANAEMPVEAARSRLLLAGAQAAIDPQLAIAEARSAFTTFERVGAAPDADAAAALLRSLGARVTRSGPRAIGVLTGREREVLALLGEGLSNPEIGQRLFITRKTVEHHVANVLAKTGLASRTEAAAFAVRHLERDPAAK
jgi:DNA-binding NarL/FixJ family response regulator